MKTFTVSFFGHRIINNAAEVERRLESLVSELLRSKEYVEFLIGRDGDFDILAASVIRRCKKNCGRDNAALVLVLPYMRADYRDNEASFLDYYDEVEICEESSRAHFKAAITLRNRRMIERSDMVVCCVVRESGGAWAALSYARKTGRECVNVGETAST